MISENSIVYLYILPDGLGKCGDPKEGPELLGLPKGAALDVLSGSTAMLLTKT